MELRYGIAFDRNTIFFYELFFDLGIRQYLTPFLVYIFGINQKIIVIKKKFYNMKRLILFILFVFGSFFGFAQEIPIGHWREHVPYRSAVGVTVVGDEVYCATNKSLFIYDRKEKTTEYLSKIDGLSDLNFTAIAYNEAQRCVVLGYSNGSIDLLKGNDIINIPDIRLSNVTGGKKINNILCKEQYAYLSTPFGIAVLDLKREEIKETYSIGENGILVNVNDLTFDDKNFYAATDAGIYWAPQNSPTLNYHQTWKVMPTPDTSAAAYPAIEYWQGQLIYYSNGIGRLISQTPLQDDFVDVHGYATHISDITQTNGQLLISGWTRVFVHENANLKYPKYAFRDVIIENSTLTIEPKTTFHIGNNQYFIADEKSGLLFIQDAENAFAEKIEPNGPYTASAFRMGAYGEDVWVAAGGHSVFWAPSWKADGLFHFDGAAWGNYNANLGTLPEGMRDVSCVAVDPFDNKKVYAGTWGKGLIEITDGVVTNVFNAENSPLQRRKIAPDQGEFVSGVAFDSKGVLWVSNSSVDNLLHALDRSGNWKTHYLGSEFIGWDIGDLMVDSYDNKWIVTRDQRCLIVYNENSDLKTRKIGKGSGTGNIESDIYSVAEDKNGELWVGTNDGIYIIRDISNVLRLSNGAMYAVNADRPKVFWDGYTTYLLSGATIPKIAVNAANEKWCSAEKVGVYKLSSDGMSTIFNFSAETTPLFSNNVLDIAITDKGEVFFATDQGVISYRDDAAKGTSKNEDVYAFPNPVKPDYDGPIAIAGVVDMAHIRIADVSGNIVYASQAKGGQAIWDARDFKGKRVKTGVYIVYITNDDGSEKAVTKIMVLN